MRLPSSKLGGSFLGLRSGNHWSPACLVGVLNLPQVSARLVISVFVSFVKVRMSLSSCCQAGDYTTHVLMLLLASASASWLFSFSAACTLLVELDFLNAATCDSMWVCGPVWTSRVLSCCAHPSLEQCFPPLGSAHQKVYVLVLSHHLGFACTCASSGMACCELVVCGVTAAIKFGALHPLLVLAYTGCWDKRSVDEIVVRPQVFSFHLWASTISTSLMEGACAYSLL